MNDIVRDIKRRMTISAVDLDNYADGDEASYVRPASDFEESTWNHIQRAPGERGGLLPWSKTHATIQVRDSELAIWMGPRGEGKSLTVGYVMAHLMSQGHRAVIASLEMPVEDTLERMERQVLAVSEPTREAHHDFYCWADGRLWLYAQSGVVPVRRIIGLCRYARQELDVQHVVIDSLMMVGFSAKSQWEKLEQQAEFARELAAIARDTGVHIHLVVHPRKGDGSKRVLDSDDVKGGGDLTDLSSVVYIIQANREKRAEACKHPETRRPDIMEQPDLFLSLDKNRRGGHAKWGLWMDERTLQLVEGRNVKARALVSGSVPVSL